jgi:hypothetical protein
MLKYTTFTRMQFLPDVLILPPATGKGILIVPVEMCAYLRQSYGNEDVFTIVHQAAGHSGNTVVRFQQLLHLSYVEKLIKSVFGHNSLQHRQNQLK